MYILFSETCPTCQRQFKAEALAPTNGSSGSHQCECPRCRTTVVLADDRGEVTSATIGWALPATPHHVAG